MPHICTGIYENKAYIYAVQNHEYFLDENSQKFKKKINRLLYKVNENFKDSVENDNMNNPQNISGISPSAIISLSIVLGLLKSHNISNIEVPTF